MADDVVVETTACIFAEFDDFVAVQIVQMRAPRCPSTLPFLDSSLDFNSHPRFASRVKFHRTHTQTLVHSSGKCGLEIIELVFTKRHDIKESN